LFENVYPELEFIKPGTPVSNIYAQYNLGWHYDINKEPALPNTIKLQQAATNILGLDFEEIKPRIAFTSGNKFDSKYVTIATNSTAGCKFWTKEGWQEVINHLVKEGYKVINVSKEKNPFDNCTQLEDYSMNNTINTIYYSQFFIGLSSGLSWLAWALGKQVVMIANFSEKDHEFSCIRITNDTLCHGCWNNPHYKFDRGDWDWCPKHKNTPRHFECHRGISANDVIVKLPL
jgi:autotransporter strand-loop-strand O-heptosyltransferase